MRVGTRGFMWTLLVLLGALVGLETGAQAGSQSATGSGQPRGRPTLAIIGIEATEAVLAKARQEGSGNDLDRIVQAFDGQLIAALTQTNRFRVTARSDLEKLLVDNDLQQVFAEDPVRALSILGTQFGMVFKVDDYRDEYVEQKARVEGRGDRVIRARRTIYISVVATIYDIEEATTLASVTTEFRATPLDKRWEGLGVDREVLESQMAGALDGVSQTLAKDVTHDVLGRMYPARIVEPPMAGLVNVSWGQGTPIEAGQTWRVFDVRQVEDVDFPGEFIEIEQPVGLIRIEAVGNRTSSARVIEDFGIDTRAICRLVRDEPADEGRGG